MSISDVNREHSLEESKNNDFSEKVDAFQEIALKILGPRQQCVDNLEKRTKPVLSRVVSTIRNIELYGVTGFKSMETGEDTEDEIVAEIIKEELEDLAIDAKMDTNGAGQGFNRIIILKSRLKHFKAMFDELDEPLEEMRGYLNRLREFVPYFSELLPEPDQKSPLFEKQISVDVLHQQLNFEDGWTRLTNYRDTIIHLYDDIMKEASNEEDKLNVGRLTKLIDDIYTLITKLEVLLWTDPSPMVKEYEKLHVDENTMDVEQQKLKNKVKEIFTKYIGMILSSTDNDTLKWNIKTNPILFLRDYTGMTFPFNEKYELLKKIYVDFDLQAKRWIEVWVFFDRSFNMIMGSKDPVIAMRFDEGIDALQKPYPDNPVEMDEDINIRAFSNKYFRLFRNAPKGFHPKSDEPKYKNKQFSDQNIKILAQMGYAGARDDIEGYELVKNKLENKIWAAQALPVVGLNHMFPSLEKHCYVIIRAPFFDVTNDPYGLYKFEDFEEGILLSPT